MVSGVAASASAKSAGDAKISATNSARRDAFLTLLSRLSLSASIANSLSNDQIFDIVRSEQITDEKIAGTNYSATFNILFARSAVEKILKEKNLQKDEAAQDLYLLIPIKVVKQKGKSEVQNFLVWDDQNEWRSVIEKSLKSKALKNFVIPDGDISNASILNQDSADKVEYSQIEPLFARYKVVGAYLLFFYYDDIENKVSITVKDIRKLQKKQVKLGFVNIARSSYEELTSKVSDKALEYIISSQKDAAVKMSNIVKFEVQITNFGNWLALKNKIESSNLITQMNIEAISKDYVRVSVNYIGSDPDIVAAFAKIGLALTNKSDNFYIVSQQSNALNFKPNVQ